MGRRQGGHAQTRRGCGAQLRACSGAWRHAPYLAARPGKRPQTIPRPCRGSQSRNSDARLVRSRNPAGGRGYQSLPVRHSDRRGDYRHDPRRVRRRWGGADHRSRIGCRLIKSRLLDRAAKPVPPAPSAAIAEPEHVLPAPAGTQFGESAPLPVPGPTELGSLESHSPFPASGRRLAQQNRRTAPPPTTLADNRTFFEKLFGTPQPSGPSLAYAAPEDGVLGNARSLTSSPPPRYDRWTAVYDVAAHTVYLPNGTRL